MAIEDELRERLRKVEALFFGATTVRIPTKPAMHSNMKPATDSEVKPAGIPI